jgi:hypothetical protein
MTRVIPHLRQALDHRGHSGQGPEVGSEPMGAGPSPQGGVHPGQLPPIQPRLAPQASGRPQASSALAAPHVIPPMGCLSADAQGVHHGRLRLAAGKHAGRREPASLQRRNIPSRPLNGSHASAWHRTP